MRAPAAVSYTHLDVYKRQIEVRVVLRINTADVHQAACDDEYVEVPTGDVYKRQI